MLACGLDFGTSNSAIGVVRDGVAALAPVEAGNTLMPSAVFFDYETKGRVLFGNAAIEAYVEQIDGRLMRALKSILGSPLIDEETGLGSRKMPLTEVVEIFVRHLKRQAESFAGAEIAAVVHGRPVRFVDDDDAADARAQAVLERIARRAGFRDVTFVYEPIAAAHHYEQTVEEEKLVLIADIGGGTSDFSLVRLSPERAKKTERRDDILATGGVHIGGTDFDKYLSLSSVMPLLGYGSRLHNNSEVPSSYYFNLATWHTINLAYTKKIWVQLADVCRDAREQDKMGRLQKLIDERAGHWLAMKVEEGKIALSDAAEVQLELDRLSPAQSLLLKRGQFDEAIGHLCGSVEETVLRLLRDAGVAPEAVDTVFFTGGSSGVRLLREKIAALVPAARKVEGDLFGSIGAGLALDAVRKFG